MSRFVLNSALLTPWNFGWKIRPDPGLLKPHEMDFKLLKLQILRTIGDYSNYTTKSAPPNWLVKDRIESVTGGF
jgi:hypothetical protein